MAHTLCMFRFNYNQPGVFNWKYRTHQKYRPYGFENIEHHVNHLWKTSQGRTSLFPIKDPQVQSHSWVVLGQKNAWKSTLTPLTPSSRLLKGLIRLELKFCAIFSPRQLNFLILSISVFLLHIREGDSRLKKLCAAVEIRSWYTGGKRSLLVR